MPDITMCTGTDCPIKDNCYRYWAEPSEFRQAYFFNPPYDETNKKCNEKWERKREPQSSRDSG